MRLMSSKPHFFLCMQFDRAIIMKYHITASVFLRGLRTLHYLQRYLVPSYEGGLKGVSRNGATVSLEGRKWGMKCTNEK